MSLADIVRNAVATADSFTTDLQTTVTHYAWTGQDDTGKPTYAAGVSRKAHVEDMDRLMRDASGQEITARHKITFLRPIAANGAANRREPIDPRDKIVMKNGVTGPIAAIDGYVDGASTSGFSYFAIIWLGASHGR
jgi:hypothetical protein